MRAYLLGFALSFGVASAQTTWIVEAGNPAALPTFAAAVTAASDGDLIEIRNANEWIAATIVLNRSLRIYGNVNGGAAHFLFFAGGVQVQLPAGKELVLANCQLLSPAGLSQPPAVLSITASAGRVLLEDVDLTFGVTIADSTQVMWSRTHLTARTPMQITNSTVVFDRCTLAGRNGDYETSTPSGEAMHAVNSTVLCANTPLRGGDAAHEISGYVPWMPGTRAMTVDASLVTMSGGNSSVTSGILATVAPIDANQGLFVFPPTLQPAISGTSTVVHAQLPSVTASVSTASLTLTVQSPIGALAALVFGSPGDRLAVPGLGELWIDPANLCVPLVGVQTGVLSWTVALPAAPALHGSSFRWQPLANVGGTLVLGTPGGMMFR